MVALYLFIADMSECLLPMVTLYLFTADMSECLLSMVALYLFTADMSECLLPMVTLNPGQTKMWVHLDVLVGVNVSAYGAMVVNDAD